MLLFKTTKTTMKAVMTDIQEALTLSFIMLKNGQTYFKDLGAYEFL